MDKQLEDDKLMENEIIKDNINNINQYIKLTDEDTLYFNLFNEYLYENHNKWLDNIKNQIKKGIDNSDSIINISDINYDNKLINIIKKIVEPHNYRNNKNNENINDNTIFDKIEELRNFNDIVGTLNICSKSKRKSLLSTIHKKRNNKHYNENNENNDINIGNNDNDIITFQEDKNELGINNNFNDEDININDYIPSHQKEKIINNNIYPYPYPYPYNKEEDEEENSLCTIVEQPSMEELEKNNTISQKSNNLFNPKQYSFSNQIKSQLNVQNNENNNNINNYLLNLNNKNNCNNLLNKIVPNSENKKNYKPLKIIESIATPQKIMYLSHNKNNNNNNILLSNSNSKLNHDNLFHSQQKSPYFAQIKNSENSSNKNNIPINNIGLVNNSQFSFNNSNKNISNLIEFTFSTVKKCENNLSNNKNNNLSNNKNNIIVLHTSKKYEQENNYLSNTKNDNNSNNKNFINILTNSIHNIQNKNNQIDNNIQKQNNLNNNELNHNNYIQNLVLSSTKKDIDNANNLKGKYEKDFDEYEMSDSSIKEDDEEEGECEKKIPKWAMDKKYINQQIKKQNNNKELLYKSFGHFVVEHLNLNMIFETHNEAFDVRHSTADWREDDSISRNKVINIDDKEIDKIFPNRKLQF